MENIKEEWEAAKWIFEPEGALRDVYIDDIGLPEWFTVIDFLNQSYPLRFIVDEVEKKLIDVDYVRRYLEQENLEMSCPSASIKVGNLHINCHFFDTDEIEFDIDPNEVKCVEDYKDLKRFLWEMSLLTGKSLILTFENTIHQPLISVNALAHDFSALTIEAAMQLYGR